MFRSGPGPSRETERARSHCRDVSRSARDANQRGFVFVAFAVAVLSIVAASGCATTPAEPAAVRIELDKETYRIGEPLVMTVHVENRTDRRMVLPRLDGQAVTFMMGEKGLNPRVKQEPVQPQRIMSEPREVPPRGETSRRFLFTRMTMREGEYVAFAQLKGVVVGKKLWEGTFFAAPVPYVVSGEVAFRRDQSSGLILKEQAEEIARREARGRVEAVRPVLVPLGDSGLYAWVVLIAEVQPDGTLRRQMVRVDPYTGRVRLLGSGDGQGEPQEPGEVTDEEGKGMK